MYPWYRTSRPIAVCVHYCLAFMCTMEVLIKNVMMRNTDGTFPLICRFFNKVFVSMNHSMKKINDLQLAAFEEDFNIERKEKLELKENFDRSIAQHQEWIRRLANEVIFLVIYAINCPYMDLATDFHA